MLISLNKYYKLIFWIIYFQKLSYVSKGHIYNFFIERIFIEIKYIYLFIYINLKIFMEIK